MGFIGSLFSGSRGAGFEPERAVSGEQAQQQYLQVQQQLENQRRFAEALQAQSPQAIADQALIARQLRNMSVGAGPSVAQSQLAQATGEGIAAQQALMAGQRGAGANVGLLARESALAGGRARQQAIGQAATLRAQEQLGAQQALAGLAGTQIGQIQGAQALGISGTSQAQQNILNAIAEANRARAGVAGQTAAGQADILGGLLGGLAGAAAGGRGKAMGGEISQEDNEENDDFFKSFSENLSQQKGSVLKQGSYQAGKMMGNTLKSLFSPPQMAQGGKVPVMVSPGEKYLPPSEVKKVASGQKNPMAAGKTIPGKAMVSGDSYANDTVPATLEEGGIVIPRSVVQSEDSAEKARQFVAAVLAKKQLKR